MTSVQVHNIVHGLCTVLCRPSHLFSLMHATQSTLMAHQANPQYSDHQTLLDTIS